MASNDTRDVNFTLLLFLIINEKQVWTCNCENLSIWPLAITCKMIKGGVLVFVIETNVIETDSGSSLIV